MKCQYWYSQCLTDSDVYSIRCKSKRQALKELKDLTHHQWGPLVLVKVEVRSLFDLIRDINSEGGFWAEYDAVMQHNKGLQNEK